MALFYSRLYKALDKKSLASLPKNPQPGMRLYPQKIMVSI